MAGAGRQGQPQLRPTNGICLAFCLVTMVGLALPFAHPPAENTGSLFSLAEYLLTVSAGTTLLLGPGLALRALRPSARVPLGFLFLPGFLILVFTGAVCWATATVIRPEVTTAVVCGPVTAALAVLALRRDLATLLSREEALALGVCGLVLLICLAKAAWSLGPVGELYAGTVSRTLEVGALSDSRISFAVVQLIAHGNPPYGAIGKSYFAPYTFASRGPLAALAAAPIVFQSGARPPLSLPNQAWVVFDPQGFAAYRVIMELLALTSFLAAFTVVRRCAGARIALFVVILLASTPFLVHEVYFTWPKLLSATFVLLGADLVLRRRPLWAGAALGVGYLCHPEALFAIPALFLLWAWTYRAEPARGSSWRPVLSGWAAMAVGIGLALGAWSVVNLGHPSQVSMFAQYLVEAGHLGMAHSVGDWLRDRAVSVANTLVPLVLLGTDSRDITINVVGGSSPPVVLFFAQYGTTLPFGIGILFYPVLLAGLVRAGRHELAILLAVVVAPFAIFAVYWGSFPTGLIRDGLQAWVIGTVMICGWSWSRDGTPKWSQSWWFRGVLASRSVEVLLMLLLPTILTEHALVTLRFAHTDLLALLIMLAGCSALAWVSWRAPHLLILESGP
ncbi:MAG TPA: hypothetical protein VMW80_03055 [Candidatus Dormibacteraeota bacterium]|nr:hypothetical protein [Candidatus Dormibacteraeota bacterium]